MERSLAISNYFIKLSQDSGKEITPLKLIKLCYLSHGWYLGVVGESLLDETVYAWKYGPVIESVYHTFKIYRDSPIKELYRDESHLYPMPNSDKDYFLKRIWEIYGDRSGVELSALTHQPGSPWYTVWNERGGKNKQYTPIPNELIQDYYHKKAAANEQPSANSGA